ncbi:MAG: DUF6273 domain-containing protein [Ruminococcus flavefaciens]|nr:DUF6273 domain-containing protein [Ruminococcus flavefaciens]
MATKSVNWKMRQRQGTASEWESKNPVLAAGEFGYDTTNDKLKIGDGKTAWNSLPTFTTTRFSFGSASWGDIAQMAAAGTAKKFFNVGDEKVVTLSTGEEVTLVILGFDHDDLTSGGKAPISIGMKNCLSTTYSMNSSNTNAGGWDGSAMRKNTMSTLLSQLPSDLQKVIKSVNKPASAGGGSSDIVTSSDKLFLLSAIELTGDTVAPSTSAPYNLEGKQYEYYKTVKDGTQNSGRIKYLSNGVGSACSWWLRSPYAAFASSFYFVNASGSVGRYSASFACGVSFGFCI